MKKMLVVLSMLIISMVMTAQEAKVSELPNIALDEVEIKEFTKKDILDIFENGPEVWNKFRQDHPTVELKDYFSGKIYKDKNLKGINLSGVNLSNSNFINTNLEGADLSKANLKGSNLYRANLRGANLEEAILLSCNLKNIVLVRANMRNTIVARIWKKSIVNKKVSNLRNISWR